MFRFNSPFMQSLTKLCYILYAHLLALACCIPVITAGAGLTALEYVLLRISREEDTGITRDFFHSFKDNFKHGTIMGLVYIAVGFFISYDIYFLQHQETGMNQIMMVATIALLILLALNMTWGFVLLSRYNNSAKKTLRYAFSVCVVHMGTTLAMLALVAIPVAVALISFQILPYAAVIGSLLSGYFRPKLYGKVFDKLESVNEENTEEESVLEKES